MFEGAAHGVIFPLPFAAIPIAVLVLVHVKEAPEGTLTKLGIVIVSPGHTAIFDIELLVGVGNTLTEKFIGVFPVQPLS